jgi:putative ATP-binding cassette transporter
MMSAEFLRRILRLAGPWWNSERKWQVRGMTLLLLLLTVAQVGITVWGNYWNRALFDALEQRSVPGVLLQVGVFALILLVSIGVTAAHLLVKRRLQLGWRTWLTDRLIGRWMQDGRHYRLQFSAGQHDNPDQRIAEDIRIATESAIALGHTLVFSLLSLGLFIDILWNVSGTMRVPGTSLQVPGYMVPLAFLYAGLGTLFGWALGRPLVRTSNALQSAEADFRFGLSRMREDSEAIALLHGEPRERGKAMRRFERVMHDWDRQSLAFLGIASFSTAYGGLLPVFPMLVAAPQYILGVMSLGALMQAAQAFQRLTSALSWPVDNIGGIAMCRTSAERVLSLYEDMQRLDAARQAQAEPRISLQAAADGRLVFEELCIAEPSGTPLLENFSGTIEARERVLVRGDPAVTTSLFKVLAGLWPWGSGRVLLPRGESILFLPRQPFLPEGTLRAALCYPQAPEAFSDAAVRAALECAGCGWLAPRLDASDNWEQVLPLRARQRLGIVRALLQRPRWLCMEEATDALDPAGERLVFEMLRRELPGTTLLTIGVHPELEALHERKITLNRIAATRQLPDAAGPH